MAFDWTSAFSGKGGGTAPVLVAAQFFIQPRLSIYYCSTAGASWSECPKEELRRATLGAPGGMLTRSPTRPAPHATSRPLQELTIDATEFLRRRAPIRRRRPSRDPCGNNRADGRGGVFVMSSGGTGAPARGLSTSSRAAGRPVVVAAQTGSGCARHRLPSVASEHAA